MNSTDGRTRVQPEARDAKLAAYYAARRPTSNAYVDGGWIRKLGPHAAAVYMTVDRYVQSTGLSSVTVAQVVDRTGMDPATVCRAFDAMILHGLLWVESEGKAGRATRYSPYAPGVLSAWNPTAAARLHGLPPEREAKARARQDARQALRRTRAARLGRAPRVAAAPKPKKAAPVVVESAVVPRPVPPVVAPTVEQPDVVEQPVVEVVAEAAPPPPAEALRRLLPWARETWRGISFEGELATPEATLVALRAEGPHGAAASALIDLTLPGSAAAMAVAGVVAEVVERSAVLAEQSALAAAEAEAREQERFRRLISGAASSATALAS